MARFSDKVVFLTGASAGIGTELARAFAREGADLALVARRGDRLVELARELGATGRKALPLVGDVARDGDLEIAAARTREELGRIDVVVANAGFGVMGKLEKLTLDDYRRQFETNVFGVLRTVYATLEDLKRSRGNLVLIGSVSGHVGLPSTSAYAMSKFAVRALAESLRHELAPDGVTVTLISPGLVTSELRQVDNQGRVHPDAKEPAPKWLVLSTDRAAKQIVQAVARGERERVITGHGKAAVFVQRHAPWLISTAIGLGVRGRPEPKARDK